MKKKRQKILEAAEKIMSEKGRKASISEISKSARVTDSVLCHYSKNNVVEINAAVDLLGQAVK